MSDRLVQGPCWVRWEDGHVAWLGRGWKALGAECERLPALDLSSLFVKPPPPAERPLTREEYNQRVWDLYRVSDLGAPCREHGLGGPDDFTAALESNIIIHEGDGTEDDLPIYLGEHVVHTVTAFAAGLPFEAPDPHHKKVEGAQ